MAGNIRSHIEIRKQLYRKAKCTRSPHHRQKKIKQSRNRTTLLIIEAKTNCYSNRASKLNEQSLSSKHGEKLKKKKHS